MTYTYYTSGGDLNMTKGYITISVPVGTTKEEIFEIRKQFQKDPLSQMYKLNILISGNSDIKNILINFIRDKIF